MDTLRKDDEDDKSLQDKGLQPSGDIPETTGVTQGKPELTTINQVNKRGRKRKDYPAIVSPSIRDIAFAAAYYEGEGYFGLNHSNDEEVKIGQNDREKLDWIQLRFGGRVYGPYQNTIGNSTYIWRLARERALGFMFTIFTFLSISRRKQLRLILQGFAGKREYTKWISDEGIDLDVVKKALEKHQNKKDIKRSSMSLFGVKNDR